MMILEKLARKKGPLTKKQIKEIQRWIDADWESHDQPRDMVKLVQRLVDTCNKLVEKK